MRQHFGTCRDPLSSFSVLICSTTVVFRAMRHVLVRASISFVRSRFVVLRHVNSSDRCADSFVGHAGFVGGRARFFVRTEHAIARRDYVFTGSLDLFGRRVIFSGRRGESFPRRDTNFRRRADFVVAHAYFFGAGDQVFLPARRMAEAREAKVRRSPNAFGERVSEKCLDSRTSQSTKIQEGVSERKRFVYRRFVAPSWLPCVRRHRSAG
jgi:hypothetical protein